MKIAIDISPLDSNHSVRGVGFYLTHLKNALEKYQANQEYIYFTNTKELPDTVDIIHYPYFDPFFLSLPIFRKAKTVVTIHDLTPIILPELFPKGIKGSLKWYVQKQIIKHVDAVITDSYASKKDIEKFIGISSSKIHVVHLAAGDEFQKMTIIKNKEEVIKKKYQLPKKFILYTGDVTPNKNLPRLLEAVADIQIPLIMVGKALADSNFDTTNEWNKDLLTVRTTIATNSNIRALGFVPTEDLVTLYNLAEVFIFPSLYEGFGLPVLEAMQSGCPVVTSQKGSLAEITKEAAYIIDPYSVKSIAHGINEVLTNKNMHRELSQKGLKRAADFSWEKTAKETVAVYEKIC